MESKSDNINMLVSVIIPVYNGEKFIPETILSIINQTFKNLEIIVIDDSSTDNSVNIIKEFCQKDQRIRLVRNEKNLGLADSLNKAITLSTGDYIARLDQDDVSELNRIEVQLQTMIDNPQIDILFSNSIKISGKSIPVSSNKYDEDNDIIEYSPDIHGSLLHSSLFGKKEALTQIGGYRKETYPADDYDLVLRLSDANYQVSIINKPLVRYRVHDEANTISKFYLLRKKSRYVKHLHALRKNSQKEISFEDYLKKESRWKVLKDVGVFSLRKSGQFYANKKYFRMLIYMIAGLIFNPDYTISKLRHTKKIKEHAA